MSRGFLAFIRILIAAVFFSSTIVVAQQRYWDFGDQHPFNTPIARLTPEQRAAIIAALEPLWRNKKKFDFEPSDFRDARRNLRVQQVTLNDKPFLFVQGWNGVPLCGATGNCALWILDQENHVILEGGGEYLRILQTQGLGMPEIQIKSDDPADPGQEITWYRNDGTHYRKYSCALREPASLDGSSIRRKVTFHRCESAFP